MDIEKAIEILEENYRTMSVCLTLDECKSHNQKIREFVKLLEELEQYRKIGTVDECRAAREKQIPKEPLKRAVGGERLRREFLSCPICGKRLFDIAYLNGKKDHITGKKSKICPNCGQALKWED